MEEEVMVMRNDELDFSQVANFSSIVISPGPGLPKDAGDLMKLLEKVVFDKKVLGICLGHQAIAEFFGMKLKNLDQVYHGVSTPLHITKQDIGIFKDIPNGIKIGRYHSWVAVGENNLTDLEVTSVDNNGNVMSISHKILPVTGVQFHPESILTEYGKKIIKNWIEH